MHWVTSLKSQCDCHARFRFCGPNSWSFGLEDKEINSPTNCGTTMARQCHCISPTFPSQYLVEPCKNVKIYPKFNFIIEHDPSCKSGVFKCVQTLKAQTEVHRYNRALKITPFSLIKLDPLCSSSVTFMLATL